MDPTLSLFLQLWAWRPEIILSLCLGTAVHLAGRTRLRRRMARAKAGTAYAGRRWLVSPWRSVSYLGGLLILGIALMSPIDILSGQFFYMHMIQHLMLVMIVPPLLLIGNPMPIMLWGLPSSVRLEIGRWLRSGSKVRETLRTLTTPGLVWVYLVTFLIGWHDPRLYGLTLQNELVHDLEHLTFFGTALLFWWHVIQAAPRIHRRLSQGVRIAFTLAVVPPTAITGAVIALSSEPIYTYYADVPRIGGMTALQDQMLGGAIMWIPGSMMYILAALILIARIVQSKDGENTRATPEPSLETAPLSPVLESPPEGQARHA
jgi:cytochrome c oxidase assembly factor CtaG